MLDLFSSGFVGKYIHTAKPTPEGMLASGTQSKTKTWSQTKNKTLLTSDEQWLWC